MDQNIPLPPEAPAITPDRDFSPKVGDAPDAPESQQHLLDPKTGQIIQAPTSAVASLVTSGGYILPQKGSQYIVDKSGSLLQVENSKYAEALKSGEYLPATDEDVRKEMYQQKYGDSEIKAAGAGLLRGVTMGLSDPFLAKTGLVEKGTLAGLQSANPNASTAGEVAGTVGGLFIPAGPIAKTATMGAKVAEKAAALGIKELEKAGVKNTVARSIIEKIAPAAAGSAVEGAAFGAGHLISESSLGKADFNAQNLVADMGAGALFGGAVGGVLGSIGAIAPAIGSKISDFTKEAKFFDKTKNAQELLGITDAKMAKNLKFDPKMGDKMVEALRDEAKVGLKITDSGETMVKKISSFKDRAGQQIDEAFEAIRASGNEYLPDAKAVYDNLASAAKKMKKEIELADGIAAPEKAALYNQISEFQSTYSQLAKKSAEGEKLGIDKLQDMRRSMDDAAKWDIIRNNDPAKVAIAKEMRYVMRQEIDSLADKVGADVGAKLKSANKDYYIASKMESAAEAKMAKSGSITLKDLVLAGGADVVFGHGVAATVAATKKLVESDFRRKAIVLGSIERANMSMQKAVEKGVVKFFTEGAQKAAKVTAVKSLVDFELSRDQDGKKPKTPAQAFNNLQTNLQHYVSQPNQLLDKVNSNTANLAATAPDTAAAIALTGNNAVQFLASKIPKRASVPGIIPRPWQPSSVDLHKFERYVQTIESPKTAIENFSNGHMSREESEALEAVYPDLFSRLQENVMMQVNKHPSMPYQKKLQMGILTNMAVDPSMMPANILGLQSNFTAPPVQGSGVVQPGLKGLENLHIDDKMRLGHDSEEN